MEDFIITGFFDTNPDSFKLWTAISSSRVKGQHILKASEFYKRSKKNTALAKRSFHLTEKYLFYKKDEKDRKIRGAMKLDWVRAEFSCPGDSDRIDESEQTRNMYSIKFIRNMKFTEIFTEERAVFEEWRQVLAKHLIMTDFHKQFKVLKMLGKGSFARVILCFIFELFQLRTF